MNTGLIVDKCVRRLAVVLLILLAITAAVPLRAEPKWIRMTSPNFEVLSSAGEKETRNTLKYFEQVREFFLKFNGHAPKEPAPVTIVIFGSEKEYAPYKFNDVAIAYFAPRSDRDYIVMGKTGEIAQQVATHEYTHLVADHAGLHYPPWLNEGLAELFSTFTILNDTSVAVGAPIPDRILAMRDDRWVPLATIMAADHDSPYYNESGKAGSLYNEGWAAVHFIAATKEYRPKFSAFLVAVASGVSSAEALQTVYGKSLSTFETELQGYIGQGAFNQLLAKIEIDRTKKEVAAKPASLFDVKIALTDLDSRPNARAERRRVLEELKIEDPKRPEPWTGLAYLDWQDGKSSQATEGFAKAYALGARSNRLLWDYGRMVQSSQPQESIKVLKELAALEPGRTEIRIELAWSQYYARQLNDAAATLAGITLATVEQAPRFLSAVAWVKMGLGDRPAAAQAIDLLRRLAKTDADRVQADRLSQLLDTPSTSTASSASTATTAVTTSSAISPSPGEMPAPGPELRPPSAPPSPPPSPPGVIANPKAVAELDAVSGTLFEFVCPVNGTDSFKFAIETPEGRKLFSFKTPTSISIRGREDATADFYCGRQEGKARVKAEYQKTTEPGVDGMLKILTFEPK